MKALSAAYCPFIHVAGDQLREGWLIPQRRLTHYLLVTSLAGAEEIVVDDVSYTVALGETYLIQPGSLADIGSRRGNRPMWLHFDVLYDEQRAQHPWVGPFHAELGERVRFLQPRANEVWGVDLPVKVPARLVPLFRSEVPKLVRAWQAGDARSIFRATSALGSLLALWVDSALHLSETAPRVSLDVRLERAERVAEQNLGTSFGLDEFAAAAGLSRSRFCAVYRQARGVPPASYLRRRRMDLALQLLELESLPVAKVGEMVGYRDLTVFGRVFRSFTGFSPSDFRRRHVANPVAVARLGQPR